MRGAYENTRRVLYSCGAQFVPVCRKCGRYVKPDDTIQYNDYGVRNQPNATCSKCGRMKMLFEGFM